ncbi:MAG: DUF2520 domain-containing protein [Bacteroidota bacterium]|nr:DUF2520 domain-containing protein [Bacteroidota bacterium]
MNIVCIGAGRLAHQLMPELLLGGHVIMQIYNRTPWPAVLLSQKLHHAEHIEDLEKITRNADVYFLAIADDAIAEIALKINTLDVNGIIVHSSGVLPLEVLPSSNRGVFYPLQTFSDHHAVEWSSTPIMITSDKEENQQKLHSLARTISSAVYTMSDTQKSYVHLSAVFSNNFTNHLLTLAEEICKAHQVPFEILKPLILTTFQKALHLGPSNSQTGPASRGDEVTISKHLQLLEQHPELRKVYEVITESIITW